MNKLIINCGLCDLRHVSEESLQAYESVVINCATAVVTRESQDVLHRFPVQINAGDILQVPAGQDVIRLQSHNGSHTLDGSAAPDGLTFLMVNGKLIIGEDALEAARQYYRIQVNGKTILPRSFTGQLTNLSVNGKTVAYPDGAALLKDTAVIDRFFPLRALGRLGATEDNLAAAMDAERFEWTHMYAEFERVAREEGFDDIAGQFGYAAAVEREHEARFRGLWERLRQGTLFTAPAPRRWRCRNCGYIHTGNAAPEICPLCAHPRGWYEWDAGWCERLE